MRDAVVIVLDLVGIVAMVGVLALAVAAILTRVSRAHEDIG